MDHYQVLGLCSVDSLDCTKLSEAEIKAAYRNKARELHPDTITRKRKRDVINSSSIGIVSAEGVTVISMTAAFQQLQSSYELLMDKEARKKFDAVWLLQKQEKLRGVRESGRKMKMDREKQENEKKEKERRMRMDRERKEDEIRKEKERRMRMDREWMENVRKEKEQQMRMERELQEERMRMERDREEKERREKEEIKKVQEKERLLQEKILERINQENNRVLDKVWKIKFKTLRVTWNKNEFGDFTSSQLRDMFEYFGQVHDVRINKNSKKGHALVLMASEESVIAATVAEWVDHPESPFINFQQRLTIVRIQVTFIMHLVANRVNNFSAGLICKLNLLKQVI